MGTGALGQEGWSPHSLNILIGILLATRTAMGRSSLGIHHHLSQDTTKELTITGMTLAVLQEQTDSLAGVTLQNGTLLNPFTASESDICLHFEEQCCFYISKSGKVQQNLQGILQSTSKIKTSISFWDSVMAHVSTPPFCGSSANHPNITNIWPLRL